MAILPGFLKYRSLVVILSNFASKSKLFAGSFIVIMEKRIKNMRYYETWGRFHPKSLSFKAKGEEM